MLPTVITHSSPSSYLASYVKTYLKEEVQQEGLVRNLPGFARFLEAATFSQASVLNMSEVARDCAISRKVVADYFQILEDLLLAVRIPVFSKKAKRDLLSSEKFFYFDNGVYRQLRPQGPLDSTEGLEGASLETLLFQEIRALNEYLGLEYEVFYWRTRKKQEIDLVLYGKRGLIAIEVKRSIRPRSDDLEALELFKEDYPMAKCIFAYGGGKRFKERGIECVPYEDFLLGLKEYL
jgi:predicted AAA+ superfamily ATPase